MNERTQIHIQKIAKELSTSQQPVSQHQVAATVELLDEGNTLPFIARYRKEATGGLDEEQLRALIALLESLRSLDDRRDSILASVEEQGKMTAELQASLMAAETKTELEDLYQPYKPKRRTRASMARDRGLQPLADQILFQVRGTETPEQFAAAFLNDEVPTPDDALAGARDIVAETVSDNPEVRRMTREKALKWGQFQAQKIDDAEDEKNVFELYYEFDFKVDRIRPHQVLAINRGEALKILRVGVDVPERDWRGAIEANFRSHRGSNFAPHMELAIEDAAKRLLLPAIERDVRRTLTELAENHAIRVFASNLRGLLSQPPLSKQTIMAIDPGYRTGCKVAVTDSTGKLLDTGTIYPHPPQKKMREASAQLTQLIDRHQVTLIAIGNGTASRETEQLVADLIRSRQDALHYLMVNEAGASVYSASPQARAEFPELDVSMRSGISLARRVLDPLAELVKIDPKSIGVGLYQHDVDQNALAQSLDGVVESVVNQVGVDVNTASPALLTHVAGIGPKLAERIVAHRDEKGLFANRRALKDVSGLGPKAFEQSAGFLRIRNGSDPLDASAIHPESYKVAKEVLKKAKLKVDSKPEERKEPLDKLQSTHSLAELADDVGTGEPTLKDILAQLVRPGRDPREDLPPPILRSDVLSMDDLMPGLQLDGTVRNVVDFGAFIDIGVKQDGLLHRSQIPFGTILSVGDILTVEILNVEAERGRIGLGWVDGA
ncbi:MAG: Tex family protein [Chloroflexota bacterium]